MARDQAKALGWVLQDSETMMFTILKNAAFFPGEQAPSPYNLYPGPPLTGVPMLDLLLLEAVQDPTRNARYKLDAEKSAQIAQSLWLKVFPL
jgi:hypothetical protein